MVENTIPFFLKVFKAIFWSAIVVVIIHQHIIKEVSHEYYNCCSLNNQSDTNEASGAQTNINLGTTNSNPVQNTVNQKTDTNENANEQLKAVTNDGNKEKVDDKKEKGISCLNEEGESVEWFLNLKLPLGFEFMSFSSKATSNRMNHYDDIRSNSAIKNTLEQYYGKENEFLSFMFNDHHPNKYYAESQDYAHSEGVLHCKDENCYFIQHSWPKFPPSSTQFSNGSSKYAQHFFCISMKLEDIDPLAEVWYNIRPKYYSRPEGISVASEYLQKNIDKKYFTGEATGVKHVKFGENVLTVYYKNKNSMEPLWNFLSKYYQGTEFYIASWLAGKTDTIDYTEKHPYYTVLTTMLNANGDRPERQWDYGSDHTKIAISVDPALPIICFGDLNFVDQKRAGAAYCFQNSLLYEAFRNEFEYQCDKLGADVVRSLRVKKNKKKEDS